MGQFGSIIAPGARLGLAYAERLLVGVTSENHARFARPGGVVVQSNHPAFLLGHLSLYPIRVMQYLNLPPGPTAYPGHYESLFKFGVECQDDPEGKIYPPLDELKSLFFASYRAAIDALESSPDGPFSEPNPAEGRMRELFPTKGPALTFYMVGHVQVHLGQFSAWRRCMGLPAA